MVLPSFSACNFSVRARVFSPMILLRSCSPAIEGTLPMIWSVTSSMLRTKRTESPGTGSSSSYDEAQKPYFR